MIPHDVTNVSQTSYISGVTVIVDSISFALDAANLLEFLTDYQQNTFISLQLTDASV